MSASNCVASSGRCPKCGGGPDVYKPFRLGDKNTHTCVSCGYKEYANDAPIKSEGGAPVSEGVGTGEHMATSRNFTVELELPATYAKSLKEEGRLSWASQTNSGALAVYPGNEGAILSYPALVMSILNAGKAIPQTWLCQVLPHLSAAGWPEEDTKCFFCSAEPASLEHTCECPMESTDIESTPFQQKWSWRAATVFIPRCAKCGAKMSACGQSRDILVQAAEFPLVLNWLQTGGVLSKAHTPVDGPSWGPGYRPPSLKKFNAGCFVATACFGSPDADEVIAFRRFRDAKLNTTAIGRCLVAFYYKVSPALAGAISRSEVLKYTVRKVILRPLLRLIARVPSGSPGVISSRLPHHRTCGSASGGSEDFPVPETGHPD